MKIVLAEPFAHKPGHYSVEAWQLTKALSGLGVDIVLVSFDGFINVDTQQIKAIGLRHFSFLSDSGFLARKIVMSLHKILLSINYFRLTNRLITGIETYSTLFLSRKISPSEEAQIICCNNGELAAFLAFGIFSQNLKLVYKTGDYGRTLPANNFGRKLKREIENFLCKRAVKNNKVIYTTNVKDIVAAYGNTGFSEDFELISPFGVIQPEIKLEKSVARNFLSLPHDTILLLVFGAGHGGKDYEIIFRAIKDDDRNYYILFAGRILPASSNDPRELSKKYDCKDKSIIVDQFIPDSEVPYYFYSADALLLSYKKTFTGASGVLLQSLGYNLPIISSDTEWIGEQVKNYNLGITFSPEDPGSLRGAMDKFLNLSAGCKRELYENVKQFSKNFSWDGIAAEHIHIFKKLLECKDRREIAQNTNDV